MQKLLLILLFGQLNITTVFAKADTSIVVFFDFNKYELTHNATNILKQFCADTLVLELIEVYGHTDQIGTEKYNLLLSQKRANSVKQFLLTNFIDNNKIIVTQGKGEKELITNKTKEEFRKENRRVVIYFEKRQPIIKPAIVKKKPEEKPQKPIEKETTLTEKIKDSTVKTGDNLILKNINFVGGRHVFLRESYIALKELLQAMQNIPTLEIQIEGHICCQMANEDGVDLDTGTKDLSVRRAKAVYDFLVSNGIEPSRMIYKGFARKFPITDESNEFERMTNRRVEIKIIKK